MLAGNTASVCNSSVRPTQPSTLSDIGNDCQATSKGTVMVLLAWEGNRGFDVRLVVHLGTQ